MWTYFEFSPIELTQRVCIMGPGDFAMTHSAHLIFFLTYTLR